jgi:hypothetical protein
MSARLGIDAALTQVGVVEATGNNDGTPAQRYNRGDNLPWCAAFCLWCNANSDETPIATSNAKFYADRSVQGFEDDMKARKWWMPPDAVPARGDYIFFGDRGLSDKSSTGRHMGIIEHVLQSSQLVLTCIEGNWGNKVSRVRHDLLYSAERARITGYARVPLKTT